MEKEFNLSDKFHFGDEMLESGDRYYTEDDIKEFIRLLKETLKFTSEELEFIDKLAGEKLK